jgi:hypothetical protein
MPLREIHCPHCDHAGFIPTDRLPGILRCSNCGCTRLVRDGGRVISPSDPAPGHSCGRGAAEMDGDPPQQAGAYPGAPAARRAVRRRCGVRQSPDRRKQAARCYYCRQAFGPGELRTYDHKISRSRGGSDKAQQPGRRLHGLQRRKGGPHPRRILPLSRSDRALRASREENARVQVMDDAVRSHRRRTKIKGAASAAPN